MGARAVVSCCSVLLSGTATLAGDASAAPSQAVATAVRREQAKQSYDTAVPTLLGSVHAKLDCSDCHVPRDQPPGLVFQLATEAACIRCHQTAAASYVEGVHAHAREGGAKAAGCLDCHGAHDIYPGADPRSRLHKRQAAYACGRCHQNPELAQHLGLPASEAASQYAESIHGRALLGGGLIVAPSCVDCHRSHAVQSSSDARSSVHATRVVGTCGACHQGIVRGLARGVHGQPIAGGTAPAVSCVDCHSAHRIQPPLAEFKLATDERCGACHQAELASHLDTYHGQAHALGGSEVAACYDCHGHHEILPANAADSPVAREQKLATCRQCHDAAPANLQTYLPHGNRRDAARYPGLYFVYTSMALLVLGSSGIFGVHALSWSGRVLLEFLKGPAPFRQRRAERLERNLQQRLTRLRRVDRVCYAMLLSAIALLCITGLPLKFPRSGWAETWFALLGGPGAARGLHRAGATLALAAVAAHLTSLAWILWRKRLELRDAAGRFRVRRAVEWATGGAAPWLGRGDLRAFWLHTKWFAGRGPEPVFGRFTYWEKLDYTAATLLLAVVFASGLALWFPELTLAVLPGSFLNVAQIIHGEEALLAVGSLLTYHVFHMVVLNRWLVPARAEPSQPESSPGPELESQRR